MISDPSQLKTPTASMVYYNEYGVETEDANKALAKKELYEDKTYYYALRDGFHLINVVDSTYNRRNATKWNFSLVSEGCFNSYINFLKTRKESAYRNAEEKSHDKR